MYDEEMGVGPVALRDVEPGAEDRLQAVFEAAGDYFVQVTGRAAPAPDAAEREVRSAASTEGRGVALIIRTGGPGVADGSGAEAEPSRGPAGGATDGIPVGAIGWWAGHPEPDLALLGMLMIVREARGRGHARAALGVLETRLRRAGITRLRTAVGAEDAEAGTFLEALGFRSTEERTRVDTDSGRLRIAFFEKAL